MTKCRGSVTSNCWTTASTIELEAVIIRNVVKSSDTLPFQEGGRGPNATEANASRISFMLPENIIELPDWRRERGQCGRECKRRDLVT